MATDDFFRARLDGMVDMRHPPAVLARRMPWAQIEASLAPLFARKARSGKLMADADLFGTEAYDLKDVVDQPLFERALAKLGPLDHDTMYGFVPALALGGEPSLERLQKLDAHVHLDILAQMTELQVMADVAQAAKR